MASVSYCGEGGVWGVNHSVLLPAERNIKIQRNRCGESRTYFRICIHKRIKQW
jgi:hypothetical protein